LHKLALAIGGLSPEQFASAQNKGADYTVQALSRPEVNKPMNEFVEDDTLYDLTCWAHQYKSKFNPNQSNYGERFNSRDVAFITFGAAGGNYERVSGPDKDPLTGKFIGKIIATEVFDNKKFYTGTNNRIQGAMTRYKHPAEAYLQKARERNHKRQGIYVKMQDEPKTENPDFDSDGNILEGVELDFNHLPEGDHPDANLRLFVDDKESWYRFDRLPSASHLDEEPTGIQWNHPDADYHRTTVWSENGKLHIEHVK